MFAKNGIIENNRGGSLAVFQRPADARHAISFCGRSAARAVFGPGITGQHAETESGLGEALDTKDVQSLSTSPRAAEHAAQITSKVPSVVTWSCYTDVCLPSVPCKRQPPDSPRLESLSSQTCHLPPVPSFPLLPRWPGGNSCARDR